MVGLSWCMEKGPGGGISLVRRGARTVVTVGVPRRPVSGGGTRRGSGRSAPTSMRANRRSIQPSYTSADSTTRRCPPWLSSTANNRRSMGARSSIGTPSR